MTWQEEQNARRRAQTRAREVDRGLVPEPPPTLPPTLGPSVGGWLLEVGGEELAAAAGTLDDLPYLPLLGASGWLVRGWSHLIASYPRVGKTTLLAAVVRDWLDLDLRVLYLTEEPLTMWQRRIPNTPGWTGLRVVIALGSEPEDLRRRAREGAEDIVVVDSIRNLLQLQDERDNSEIARAVNPWVGDARVTGKTLVMLHHHRKGGGENGEGIAGGHALMAAFDIPIDLLRDSNQARNRRVLRSYPRLIEGREAVYEQTAEGLRLLGDPRDVALDSVKAKVRAILVDDPSRTLKVSEVREKLGDPKPGDDTIRKALDTLVRDGLARRDPVVARPGATYRWSAADAAPGVEPDQTSDGSTYGPEVRFGDRPELTAPIPHKRCPLDLLCSRTTPDGLPTCCGQPLDPPDDDPDPATWTQPR